MNKPSITTYDYAMFQFKNGTFCLKKVNIFKLEDEFFNCYLIFPAARKMLHASVLCMLHDELWTNFHKRGHNWAPMSQCLSFLSCNMRGQRRGGQTTRSSGGSLMRRSLGRLSWSRSGVWISAESHPGDTLLSDRSGPVPGPVQFHRAVDIAQKLVKSCSKVGQKLVRSWSKVGQTLVRSWSKVGQKLVRSWSEVGQKLVKSWSEVGQKLVKSWSKVGQKLVRSWSEVGQKLVRS